MKRERGPLAPPRDVHTCSVKRGGSKEKEGSGVHLRPSPSKRGEGTRGGGVDVARHPRSTSSHLPLSPLFRASPVHPRVCTPQVRPRRSRGGSRAPGGWGLTMRVAGHPASHPTVVHSCSRTSRACSPHTTYLCLQYPVPPHPSPRPTLHSFFAFCLCGAVSYVDKTRHTFPTSTLSALSSPLTPLIHPPSLPGRSHVPPTHRRTHPHVHINDV